MATSIKLDDDLKARVQRLAEQQDRTPHWIMREAIRSYVEREEAHAQWVAEALVSWRTYQESGEHLSLDEVREWVKTWGTEDEGPPPPCHG